MQRIPTRGLLLGLLMILMSAPGKSQNQGTWVDANGNVHFTQPAAGGVPPAATQPAAMQPSATQPAAAPRMTAQPKPTQPVAVVAANRYQSWQDPAEGAFSVSLPVGWQITGGTVRTTRIEAHYVIRAQSPDGGVRLFMDDPKIMMREVPNRATQMLGTRIGQVMPTGSGTNLILEPYRGGAQFAGEYVQQSLCPSATMMRGGPIPAQTQALNAQFAPVAQAEGKTLHVDAGDVSFKCGTEIGYAYAITVQAFQPGGQVSIWAVYRIAGYLSTPADSASAAAAVNHALGTFQMNPTWLQNYARECNDTAGNVIRESNAITQTTIQRSQQMQAQEEANYASWKKNSDANFNAIEKTNNAITNAGSSGSGNNNGNGHDYNAQLGTKTVCNDVGSCQTVDADVDTWYSDCSGQFYPGTNTGEPPPASLSACWAKGH